MTPILYCYGRPGAFRGFRAAHPSTDAAASRHYGCLSPDEAQCLAPLLEAATLGQGIRSAFRQTARRLVTDLRTNHKPSGFDGLVQEYSLSSEEGVALMCLAEALLRIPDDATRDALVRDKIAGGDGQAGRQCRRPWAWRGADPACRPGR